MCLSKEQIQPFSEIKIKNNTINCYMVAEVFHDNHHETVYYPSNIILGQYKKTVKQSGFVLNSRINYSGFHSFIHLKDARWEKNWLIDNDDDFVTVHHYDIIKCSTHINDVIAYGYFRGANNAICLRTKKMFYSEAL